MVAKQQLVEVRDRRLSKPFSIWSALPSRLTAIVWLQQLLQIFAVMLLGHLMEAFCQVRHGHRRVRCQSKPGLSHCYVKAFWLCQSWKKKRKHLLYLCLCQCFCKNKLTTHVKQKGQEPQDPCTQIIARLICCVSKLICLCKWDFLWSVILLKKHEKHFTADTNVILLKKQEKNSLQTQQ